MRPDQYNSLLVRWLARDVREPSGTEWEPIVGTKVRQISRRTLSRARGQRRSERITHVIAQQG
jgi:hypothetical protein